MTKILKVIGSLLWIGSGGMMVFALMVRDLNGVNAEVFDILKWTFAVAFIFASPYYLWVIFDNTLFLSEKRIKELRLQLYNKAKEYDKATMEYTQATYKCVQDIQELKEYLEVKSKEQKIKEINALFYNTPLTDEIKEIRKRILQYIENNG